MPNDIDIEVHGLEELKAAFDKFPLRVARNMSQAAHESAKDHILPTEGLQNYPPLTSANQPPTPYYKRGTGMQTSASRNLNNSENMGKQWTVKREGWIARIGNRASYAKWVHGDEQARGMSAAAKIPKGWRKLYEVAKEKIGDITRVYQGWVDKTLRDCGLK